RLPDFLKCVNQAVESLQDSSIKTSLRQYLASLKNDLEGIKGIEDMLKKCMEPEFDKLMIQLLRGISCEYLRQNWDILETHSKFCTENERSKGMNVNDFLLAKAGTISPDDPLMHISRDDSWALSHALGVSFVWNILDLGVREKPVFFETIRPAEPIVPAFQINL